MEPLAHRVTHAPRGNDQILYFTTTSLGADGKRLYFISDRDGHPDLYVQDLDQGEVRRLGNNTRGRLWQYQGFDGNRGQGLGVWSVALDAARERLYHIQDDDICVVDRDGVRRKLATVPDHQTTAFIDVSTCGRFLCVPTTDERALVEPTAGDCAPGGSKAIDRRCQELGLCSFLDVYDTESGQRVLHEAVPRSWITHVQFSPGNPRHILYNHEWPSMVGVRRMWLWDGESHRCLRPAGEGRTPDDWASHEVWSPGSSTVVYHGGFHQGPALVARVDATGENRVEVPLPANWHRYGHFQVHPNRQDLLASDGYFETESDAPGKGRWISLVKVHWAEKRLEWIPLCRHNSSWNSQDDHPHPIFDHGGKNIYFTGGTPEGGRAVYRVDMGDLKP